MKISTIRHNLWILRSLHKTIYFNLKCLPFRQALKLPILLYKPKLRSLEGKVRIESGVIRTGMIKLGLPNVSIYPDTGIMLELRGEVVFQGSCLIGNASYISVSEGGKAIIGDAFQATTSLKLVCYDKVSIGRNVLVGWDCLVCDNDFHTLSDKESGLPLPNHGPISIGDRCWIANGCCIMKNATLPPNSVVASHSMVNRCMDDIPGFSIIAGTPAVLRKTGVIWDY